MAAASYDQLLKQVEALKMENTNLRQELEDNSNHLTKLETEASNMKVILNFIFYFKPHHFMIISVSVLESSVCFAIGKSNIFCKKEACRICWEFRQGR